MRGWRTRWLAPLTALALLGGSVVAAEAKPPGLTCDDPSGLTRLANECPVLHPGDPVEMPGFLCTLNFLWRGSDGFRYMGTAGHCAEDTPLGGRVDSGTGKRIGQLAYKVFDSQHERNMEDLALIRVDPRVKTSAQMQHWGGPTKVYRSMTDEPQTLLMTGQATGVSYAAPDRRLIATAVTQRNIIRFLGPVSLNDSGAPVITEDGQAAGWIVSGADGRVPASTSASGGIEVGESFLDRIDPMVSLAERALRIRLTLQTAPLRVR